MHSQLDRGTLLAGLTDELRPLLPSLRGALGDLCAGLGQAEAAGQALETAYIIRAAAETLDLDQLAEAGSLVEAVVPLLNGAPPRLLPEALAVVQALMTALEQATESLVEGGDLPLRSGPCEALETARSGIERLRFSRSDFESDGLGSAPSLEEMLTSPRDVPVGGGFARPDEASPEPTIRPAAPTPVDAVDSDAPPTATPQPALPVGADEWTSPAVPIGPITGASETELAPARLNGRRTVSDVDAQILEVFQAEAAEVLADLGRHLAVVRDDPAEQRAAGDLRRACHTLKGAANVVGFPSIGLLCKSMEDLLDALAEAEIAPDEATLGFLQAGYETLEQLVPNPADTGSAGRVAELSALGAELTLGVGVPAQSTEPDPGGLQETSPPGAATWASAVDVAETLEQQFGRATEELRHTVARLRHVAQYLEDRYEVAERIRTAPDEPRRGDFDELEMDRYTELHRVSREITQLAADAETTSDDLDFALKELDVLAERQARLGNDLQDRLVAMRQVPLSRLANRLQRTARSVALKQEKEVELVVPGGQTELDKRVLEELGSVLLHLIRNAVDHGLESPEERSRLASRSWGPCACALPGSAVRR